MAGSNPQYKIRCSGSTIMIGGQEFLSASDALELYISQYEDIGLVSKSKVYQRSANDLLNPKSALHMTAERSLETGVRGTENELELSDAKDTVNESLLKMKKSVALRAEGIYLQGFSYLSEVGARSLLHFDHQNWEILIPILMQSERTRCHFKWIKNYKKLAVKSCYIFVALIVHHKKLRNICIKSE